MTESKRPPSPIDEVFLTDDPDAGTLILVRHGQQQWPDPETSTTGDWVDPPLSELGRRQAEAVGRYLAGEHPSAVYSSQLSRANDTGKAIAAHHGLDVHIIEDLEEIKMFGELPPDKRAVDTFGQLAIDGMRRRFIQTRSWDAYAKSEPSAEFQRRIGYSVEGILAAHPGETVVVACHGGVINVVLSQVIGLDVDFIFRPAHASVHRFRFKGAHRVMETVNEQTHLRAENLLSH
ncbi:MAG: histidine phosphatase family protein [Actinomycetota bacterium]